MDNQTYEEATTEVLDILNHTAKNDLEKIPPKFIEFLIQNSSKTYIPKLDHTKELKNMNLRPKTRAILCLIYKEYFCDEKEKKEYDYRVAKAELEHQKELQAKYNTDNLFKTKISEEQKPIKDIVAIENKEKNFFEKILNIIFKLIGKKNK